MKKGIGLALLSAALFAGAPASAQSVDEKIKAMEQELTQLKEQQIELKKEATAAAVVLPNFSYRPGAGLTIEAADKGWSINFSLEGHMRMNFQAGRDHAGRTNGEVEGRRFRSRFNYCINNCFYEFNLHYDNDGFGGQTDLQRGQMQVHFEKINPWLPRVAFGMDGEMPVSAYRQGSGTTGSQAEYDIMSRENGLNTGSYGNGFTLNWDNINIPTGRIQVNFGMASFGEAGDGYSNNTDRKDFVLYARIEPFSKTKNKWIQGFGLENMHYWCNNDPRNTNSTSSNGSGVFSACSRLRLRDHGSGGRQTLFIFSPSSSGGRGTTDYNLTGIGWKVGPYWLRAIRGAWDLDAGRNSQGSGAKGRNFLIGHDLFLWSPKGWFTGDTGTPGSILFGTHFERNDVSCGRSNCATGSEFSRNRVLIREWDLFYFLPNRISVGGTVQWYDASNLRSGRTEAQENLGCSSAGRSTRGKSCDWTNVQLNFRASF
ncbi:MAG: hypothetical protein FJ145_14785 [Deltaproteobacteria bacterium]|nr:hypothetical protein [Deltaproteobacteria bacterium]